MRSDGRVAALDSFVIRLTISPPSLPIASSPIPPDCNQENITEQCSGDENDACFSFRTQYIINTVKFELRWKSCAYAHAACDSVIPILTKSLMTESSKYSLTSELGECAYNVPCYIDLCNGEMPEYVNGASQRLVGGWLQVGIILMLSTYWVHGLI
eukprot:sb/3473178/